MRLKDTLDALAQYEMYCYDNEASFLLRFGKGDCWQLVRISFSCEVVYFTYVLHSGQHIGDQCRRNEFIEWIGIE